MFQGCMHDRITLRGMPRDGTVSAAGVSVFTLPRVKSVPSYQSSDLAAEALQAQAPLRCHP